MIKVAKHGKYARETGKAVLHALQEGVRFSNSSGTWRGDRVTNGYFHTGRLPLEHANQIKADQPDYVVYSYGTPIAWHGINGWVYPEVKYSVTTTSHQSPVAAAVAKLKG